MPSKSRDQQKLMRAVAHSKKFADKVGIPQKVGKDFEKADKKSGNRSLPKRVKHSMEYEDVTLYKPSPIPMPLNSLDESLLGYL